MVKTDSTRPLVKLRLARDLARSLKRGNPWVFAESLADRPAAAPGSGAVLLDKGGREVARGFYDPGSPIAFRACSVVRNITLDEHWAMQRLQRAVDLRARLFRDGQTTGYRLVNGEGDGMPGLVCDRYGDSAVLQFDGEGPRGFWDAAALAQRLAELLGLKRVYHKPRSGDEAAVHAGAIVGSIPEAPVEFHENAMRFAADLVNGQKTGFFLDQRENRSRIRALAAGRRVMNMFGYTGGFSVAAGLGGAREVTTVDVAQPALDVAQRHWVMNGLPPAAHRTEAADAFQFLDEAAAKKQRWQMVILDPPSFAASHRALPAALASYQRLVAAGATVCDQQGLLAAASCSSHVRLEQFLSACEEGISDARRRATVLEVHGQPADHPTPLALPEFRYLKFMILLLD